MEMKETYTLYFAHLKKSRKSTHTKPTRTHSYTKYSEHLILTPRRQEEKKILKLSGKLCIFFLFLRLRWPKLGPHLAGRQTPGLTRGSPPTFFI
jgi:hypothetical protein